MMLKSMKEDKKHRYKMIGTFIFFIYIIILVNLLFFSDYYGRTQISTDYRFNLIPFKEIKRFIFNRNFMRLEDWTTNLFGNIIVFMPLGFFLPVLRKGYRKILYVVINCFFISLCIEVLQLYYKVGIFDVDDLFLNTLGGFLGYLLYKLCYFKYCKKGIKNGKQV